MGRNEFPLTSYRLLSTNSAPRRLKPREVKGYLKVTQLWGQNKVLQIPNVNTLPFHTCNDRKSVMQMTPPSWQKVILRGFSLAVASGDHSLVAVLGLLLAVASLVAKHGLCSVWASVVGTWTQ